MSKTNAQEQEKRSGHMSVMDLIRMSSAQDPEMHMVSAKPIYVSPEDAKELLGTMCGNRNIKAANQKRIENDLLDGTFDNCVENLVVDTASSLCDGQHRLQALINTGVGAWFFIVVNFPIDGMRNIDRNAIRSEADAMKISGGVPEDVANTAIVALVNALSRSLPITTGKASAMTISTKERFINRHHDELLQAERISMGGEGANRLCGRAGVQAAVFVALCAGVDAATLERFCRCVNTGVISEKETPALRLRDYLTEVKISGGSRISDTMRISENAICDFVSGKRRIKAYPRDVKHIYAAAEGMPTFD